MDGDTQPTRRPGRRLPLAVVAVALVAAAIWAGASLAGGSGPATPAKAKVTQVDRGPAGGGFYTGGNGGSKQRDGCREHRIDSSDV